MHAISQHQPHLSSEADGRAAMGMKLSAAARMADGIAAAGTGLGWNGMARVVQSL